MDRIDWKTRVGKRIWFPLICIMIIVAFPVSADVILAPAPEAPQARPYQYPESRFGQAPAQPMLPGSSRAPAHNLSRSPASETNSRNFASIVPDSRKGIQEVAIIASDLGYFPKTVFVTRNVPVRMYVTGASKEKKALCIMMDSFNVKKQVQAQRVEEISFTPSVPGQYRYYCPMNGMEGTLIVKEVSTQY